MYRCKTNINIHMCFRNYYEAFILIFSYFISVITLFASQNYFKQQSLTFEDCVISNINNYFDFEKN